MPSTATMLALSFATLLVAMSTPATSANSPRLIACCHHWECPKYHLCCHDDDRIGEGRTGVCRLVDDDPNVCASPFNGEESIVSMNCCTDAGCLAGEQCSWQDTGIPSRCL